MCLIPTCTNVPQTKNLYFLIKQEMHICICMICVVYINTYVLILNSEILYLLNRNRLALETKIQSSLKTYLIGLKKPQKNLFPSKYKEYSYITVNLLLSLS
jgi:ATP-dependent protease Clp ATPase subunit